MAPRVESSPQHAGGKVGIIDYGQSKQLPDDARIAFAKLIVALDKEDKPVRTITGFLNLSALRLMKRLLLARCSGRITICEFSMSGQLKPVETICPCSIAPRCCMRGVRDSDLQRGRLLTPAECLRPLCCLARTRRSMRRCGRWGWSRRATTRSCVPPWPMACSIPVAGAAPLLPLHADNLILRDLCLSAASQQPAACLAPAAGVIQCRQTEASAAA